jgi:hypothetical protein
MIYCSDKAIYIVTFNGDIKVVYPNNLDNSGIIYQIPGDVTNIFFPSANTAHLLIDNNVWLLDHNNYLLSVTKLDKYDFFKKKNIRIKCIIHNDIVVDINNIYYWYEDIDDAFYPICVANEKIKFHVVCCQHTGTILIVTKNGVWNFCDGISKKISDMSYKNLLIKHNVAYELYDGKLYKVTATDIARIPFETRIDEMITDKDSYIYLLCDDIIYTYCVIYKKVIYSQKIMHFIPKNVCERNGSPIFWEKNIIKINDETYVTNEPIIKVFSTASELVIVTKDSIYVHNTSTIIGLCKIKIPESVRTSVSDIKIKAAVK